jgi:hypothetical protein
MKKATSLPPVAHGMSLENPGSRRRKSEKTQAEIDEARQAEELRLASRTSEEIENEEKEKEKNAVKEKGEEDKRRLELQRKMEKARNKQKKPKLL